MKVAIVCDWLTNVGGAEKVLLEIHRLYPEAPIYTSKYSRKGIDWFSDADVRTGWLQIFPVFLRRFLGPLRQRWFSHLNLSEYDLVISVTGAEAKAVSAPNGMHVCYCHVPTQYYWQMYDEYVANPGFGILNPLVRVCFKALVMPLRAADFKAASKVDYFVTISEYARELIGKYYKREAIVIHPPVEIDDFKAGPDAHILSRAASPRPVATGEARSSSPCQAPEALRKNDEHHPPYYYITTSRQVTWKRLDLAVKACLKAGRQLLVVGEGPEHKNLVKMAGGSELIKFVPLAGKKKLAEYLAGAKGYLFPSLEPFGIAPVEALVTGCPVIAFGKGGALDYVVDGKNGVLFEKQSVNSLIDGILRFEKMKFDRAKVSRSADGFSVARFDDELVEFVNEKIK